DAIPGARNDKIGSLSFPEGRLELPHLDWHPGGNGRHHRKSWRQCSKPIPFRQPRLEPRLSTRLDKIGHKNLRRVRLQQDAAYGGREFAQFFPSEGKNFKSRCPKRGVSWYN